MKKQIKLNSSNHITLHKAEEEIHSWVEVEEFGRKAFYAGREWEENRFPRCDYRFKRPTYNGYLRELDIVPNKAEEKMYTREELQEYLYELGFWCGNVTRNDIKKWIEKIVK